MSNLDFQRVREETLEQYLPWITPRNNVPLMDLLVEDTGGKLWILNPVGWVDVFRAPRAMFAYLLARPFANAAEVRILDTADVQRLRSIGVHQAMDQCFIGRVAETIPTEELPCKTLDQATAAELVFSLWIRRRDAHAENRGYNADGIPSFFDFDVAFGAPEPDRSVDAVSFFGRKGPGEGGDWFLQQVPEGVQVTTELARAFNRQSGIHLVHSLSAAETAIREVAEWIVNDPRDLRAIATESIPGWSQARGHPQFDPRAFVPFLNQTRSTLLENVEVMLDVILGRKP